MVRTTSCDPREGTATRGAPNVFHVGGYHPLLIDTALPRCHGARDTRMEEAIVPNCRAEPHDRQQPEGYWLASHTLQSPHTRVRHDG